MGFGVITRIRWRSWAVGSAIAGLGVLAILAAHRSISRSTERAEAIRSMDAGDIDAAIPHLKRVLEYDPDDVEMIRRLVGCMIERKVALEEVMPWLDRWCELCKDDPIPYLARMKARYVRQLSDEALADARTVLQLRPDNQEARLVSARILRHFGRYDEARRDCSILVEARSLPEADQRQWAEAMTLLVLIEVDRGDNATAIRLLDQVIIRRPELYDVRLLRGEVHYKVGENEAAITDFTEAARSPVPSVKQSSLNRLGLALSRLGRKEEAQRVFDRLTKYQTAVQELDLSEASVGDWAAHVRAAKALKDAELPAEAIKHLEAMLNRLGSNREALLILADCYVQVGKQEIADEIRIRAGRKLDPPRSENR